MRRFGTRGEGRAGCIFWISLAVIVALVAFEVIPIKIATMQLEDHMKELAMTQPRKGQDWFEKKIRERADELDLEIPKEQVKVRKKPNRIIMEVKFTKRIVVLGFDYDWDIEINLDRDLFLF